MSTTRVSARPPFWAPPEEQAPPVKGSRLGRRFVRERPLYLERRFQVAFDRVVFLGIFFVLLTYFTPGLLLSVTTTTGGDTGAHIYTPWYLRHYLLPKGRISGWSPDWYAGFPILQFYFPLVSIFQALLSFAIPYEVAFKMGTILGTFFLPVAVYVLFRLLRFAWPIPALGAIASIGFLMMTSYSIYGGNIPSSLSGEYGYALSLGLSLVAVGLLYRLATEEKGRPLLAAGVLAMAVLSHLLPVVIVIFIAPLLFVWAIQKHGFGRALKRFAIVFGLAFALTAFWSIPFVARLSYTADMRWDPLRGLKPVFPSELWLYLGGMALALVVAFLRRDKRFLIILVIGAIGVLFYLYLPAGSVWNGRFLPFYYLAAFLATAYFAGAAVQAGARALSVRRAGSGVLVLSLGVAVVMGAWALGQRGPSYIDNWIHDNYTGYESRPDFATFKQLNDRLAKLPYGRVFWEPNDGEVKFGTPIALMSIPYWSGQPTMEGINYESSPTTPFHFVMASELADKPANPIPGLPYETLDLNRGTRHMELLDVRYYLAFTDAAKKAAAQEGLEKIDDIGDFSLFKIDTPGQVVIPGKPPVAVASSGAAWVDRNLRWFSHTNSLDQPLVRVSKREWAKVAKAPLTAAGTSIPAKIERDQITFTTTAIGQPHWIKTSYFPNWKVQGAKGPYLASPSMMMVVPTQAHVRLYYARTWAEWLGLGLTFLAFVLMALPKTRRAMAKPFGRGRAAKAP